MAEHETVPTRQQTPTPTQAPQVPSTGGGLSAPRVQLKRGVQMMGFAEQSALLEPDAAVQKSGGGADQVHEAAAHGIASGGGAMPHGGAIQQAFGAHDVSGIQAHTGGAAKEANQAMGAEAYATGNHIAFGQSPDLHTAAHEAAHVIQQEHGVSLSGGVGKVGDAYENHADKVADAVVSGKSAEPILNEMTGGGGGGGATQKKAIQLMASSDPVQMVAPTPPAPAPAPTPVPVPTPEEKWRTDCDAFEPAVKAVALLITDQVKRDKFKTFNPVEMRAYANAGMSAALRDEFLGFAGWQDRTAIVVMQASATHFALYSGLATAAEKTKFRAITPDERQGLTTTPAPQVSLLLADEAKLNEWRTYRNVQAVSANPAVLGALGVTDPLNAPLIAEELAKISTGKAGERMRRLITEQGFETPSNREDSIKDIRDRVKAGADPWAAMEAAKATWVLKGKLTKADGSFQNVPILKAIPYLSMCQYGRLDAGFKDELITATGKTPDAATRAAFDADQGNQAAAGFRAWKNAGGVFNPSTHITAYSVQGRGNAGAYWMYSAAMVAVCDPAVGGQDVIKACAIEESPEYNMGFVIVQLPTTDPTMANTVRRPTMWDGLQFDQFAGVDSPTQCFGVTSGGTGEVVVAPTSFSACVVKRNVRI